MQKTINIAPWDCRAVNISDGKFTLIFDDHNKKIKINLENWWIRYIAEELHKVIKENQEKLDDLKRSMCG